MEDQRKTFWLGLFIVATFAVIAWLVLFLRPSFGDEGKKLRVLFTNVDKITVGTRVTFAGKAIGEVKKIKELPNIRTQGLRDEKGNLYVFEVELAVDSCVKVFNFDEIFYSASGLMGEKTITIIPKSAPQGSELVDVSHDILYAYGVDNLDDMLTQVKDVSHTIKDVFDKNGRRMEEALDHIAFTMREAGELFVRLEPSVARIVTGEGSLGRLIQSDAFYIRMNSLISRFELTLDTINRYGLLFQFSGKWRREKALREYKKHLFADPCAFYTYVHEKMSQIRDSLVTIGERLGCCGDGQVGQEIADFLNATEEFEENLEIEMMGVEIGR